MEPAFLRRLCTPVGALVGLLFFTPCLSCGKRVESAWLGCYCRGCWGAMPWGRSSGAAGAYEGRLREAVHRWKFEGRRSLTRPFAAALAEAAGKSAEAVAAVPPTEASLREKGFDHALELARLAAKELKLPLLRGVLRRVRQGPPQRTLSRRERWLQARGAFAADLHVRWKGRTLLLLDDVRTTGATLRHAALALRRAGAGKVICLALAAAARIEER